MTADTAGPTGQQQPPPGGTAPGAGPVPGWQAPGPGGRAEPGRARLYRSSTDRVWAGVCGGLAQHFGWDPSAARVGYAVLALLTGIFPMLVLYVVMALVIPLEPGASVPAGGRAPAGAAPVAARNDGVRTLGIVFGALLVLGGSIALLERYLVIDWSWVGPAIVIGLGLVVLAATLGRRTDHS